MKYYSEWPEVWILGNGPSAQLFDFEAYRPGRILTINEGAKRIMRPNPERHAVFSVDSIWLAKNKKFLANFAGEKYAAVPLDTFPECGSIAGMQYLKRLTTDGLTEDKEAVCVNTNSGYGAINLAINKGATLIHLLGYDMDPQHDPQYAFWAPAFRNMKNFLKDRSIRVLNHNPASFIDAFDKVPLEVAA